MNSLTIVKQVMAVGLLASTQQSFTRSFFTNSLVIASPKKRLSLSSKFLLAAMSSSPSSLDEKAAAETKKRTPITILSGFLGAGKTSFLQNALENDQGMKFGLIVNDVAAVNVDSKLIKKQTMDSNDGVETLELQNGCVCCSLADDMMLSIAKLITMSNIKGTTYDHIIVECSGIAEPRKIRDIFQEAEDIESLLVETIKLDTLITLVDAKLFLTEFGSDTKIINKASLAVDESDKESVLQLQRDNGNRQITELLLEQVECADIVVINKCDLLPNPNDILLVKRVIEKVNPNAKVYTCSYGKVEDPLKLLGSAKGQGAADWGILDEHRLMLEAAKKENEHDHSHTHSHDAATACAPECNDPTHNHDHSHSHSHDAATACAPECNDPTHNHDHSHSHSHDAATACAPECNDPTHNHDHSHSHSHDAATACAPECNDPTHNHDHSHSHAHDATTAETRFGITSFVYRRRRPFHPVRFSLFLNGIGKLSIKGVHDIAGMTNTTAASGVSDTGTDTTGSGSKHPLLRSKGFVWMATSGHAAYFMSHAGQYLELSVLGRWWADIPKNSWPPGGESEIMLDFEGSHGDRRQELVFIGQYDETPSNNKNMIHNPKSKKALENVLDSCLLTDEEMKDYERVVGKGEDSLRDHYFPNNPMANDKNKKHNKK